jgi:Domain of unknown function (DUF397)
MEQTRSRWLRSHACEEANCVEVRVGFSEVLLRHSHEPDGPILEFTIAEWKAFLIGASAGEFDPEA